MVRLIQKSGYIKAGSASGYMKYIATRERVEKLEGSGPVTTGQRQLIENLLRDFPDANKLDEYSGYRLAPTTGNASALIGPVWNVTVSMAYSVIGRCRWTPRSKKSRRTPETCGRSSGPCVVRMRRVLAMTMQRAGES